jgi:putative hydrolase of the HAD superfamily
MSAPWPIHTLVFDLDDTLYAERCFALSGFRAAGRWLEIEKGIPGLAAVAVRFFEQGLRRNIFDQALEAMSVPVDEALVTNLVGVFREHTPEISLLPDALDCLEWGALRYRMALVTDGYHRVQQRKVQALSLGKIIPVCIFTDAFGREHWKPSPKGFREVMHTFSGQASGFVYIADNPRKDFIAPRALGWRSIRVRRPGAEHFSYEPTPAEAADVEVGSLSEVLGLLSSVNPG